MVFDTDRVGLDTSNPEPRCPCVLLLDTSSSMSGQRISELNAGLKTLKAALSEDKLAMLRVEIAIITFGGSVNVVQDFVTVEQFTPPSLTVSGNTPMGTAINTSLDKLQERKQLYRSNGLAYYRPWIFLITDGAPTDTWETAAKRVQNAENDKKVAFFSVGVEEADINILNQISTRQPLKLKGLNFQEMFVWLSSSLTSVSHSNPGDKVPLQAPMGWTEV